MFSLHYPKFVEETILELLHTYRVEEVQAHTPYMVNPLTVSVQPSGKKRFILDLRCVNKTSYQTKSQVRRLEDRLVLLPKRSFHDIV